MIKVCICLIVLCLLAGSCDGWKAVYPPIETDIDQNVTEMQKQEPPERYVLTEVSGYYIKGFETSYLKPCGSKEQWWTSGGGLAESYRKIVPRKDRGRVWVFIRLSGMLSDSARYGHMSKSRRFRVIRVDEIRLSKEGDCK